MGVPTHDSEVCSECVCVYVCVSMLSQFEKVIPFFPDKVPGQRHSHHIPSHALDGGGGVLPADLGGVQRELQVPCSSGTDTLAGLR